MAQSNGHPPKMIYYFGRTKTEGNGHQKELLGGKGANLAEMTSIGLPVPPGFTITTEVCDLYYKSGRKLPAGLMDEVRQEHRHARKGARQEVRRREDPLLVSVRCGAARSMPGMMDTILNLGLNDESVVGIANATGNQRFAYDAYRRLINMFGDVVCASITSTSRTPSTRSRRSIAPRSTPMCHWKAWSSSARTTRRSSRSTSASPSRRTRSSSSSWRSKRCSRAGCSRAPSRYRQVENITGLLGTAVNVQSMVFGNMGDDSGTGVAFTRNPATGENKFYGEFLINAQGEDVVAGIRTPQPVAEMEKWNKKCYDQLIEIKDKLEQHYQDVQDIEFTIERDKLFMLQTRNGKRTGAAAVKIACDMVKEKLIDEKTAVDADSGRRSRRSCCCRASARRRRRRRKC